MFRSNSSISPRLLTLCCAVLIHGGALAENVDPTGSGAQYAWGENVGWLNGEPQGNGGPGIQVGDTALTGWIWAENAGWISLSCQNTASCGTHSYGVVNDGKGNLSGHAWGENIGWIAFRTSAGSDCCVEDGTPGCTDSACEAALCAVDPYCCNVAWDGICAGEASSLAACSTGCATDPFGVRIHGFTGTFSGRAWAENAGWIHFGAPSPVGTEIDTSWSCPDPDADGICSASDSCPSRSNPDFETVPFGQDVIAPDETSFTWPSLAEFELATGTFTSSASLGAFVVDFYDTGSGGSYADPSAPPASGQGYWYVFRPNCPAGSYSTGSPYEEPGRDEALTP